MDIKGITRALSGVSSVEGARGAFAAVLDALATCRDLGVPEISGARRGVVTGELERYISQIEAARREKLDAFPTNGSFPVPQPWWTNTAQPLIMRAYINGVAGVEGESQAMRSINFADILTQRANEVASGLGGFFGEALDTAGSAIGGGVLELLKGAWPLLAALVAVAVGIVIVRRVVLS